jgi:hypothetical protein
MRIGRWGLGLAQRRFRAAADLGGRALIVALAAVGILVYIGTALWFDLAYWVLKRFVPNRVGERTRVAISIGVVVLFIAAIGVSGSAGPKATPGSSAVSAVPLSLAAEASRSSATPPTLGATPLVTTTGAIEPSPSPTATALPTGLPSSSGSAVAADRLPGEPDPMLTPGALNPAVTQATIGSTICVSGWTDTIRPVVDYTNALKIQQIMEYGYSDTSTLSYEEDHLISLELGGAPNDPANLWPEPRTASLPDGRPSGSSIKDGFETRLKTEVCAGTLSLAQAQAEIGDHWVHAYYGIPLAPSNPSPGTTATASPSAPPTAGPSDDSSAELPVRISSLPASVRHGATASLIAVTLAGATCSARVTYASGTVSTAAGLKPEPKAGSTGKVSWTWVVGSRTKPGLSTASVSCWLGDRYGSASKDFRVT